MIPFAQKNYMQSFYIKKYWITVTVVVCAGIIFQLQLQPRSRHGKTASNNNIRYYAIVHKNIHEFNATLQNMTHFITWTHHINPNLPASVVFLMIKGKLRSHVDNESGDSVETVATSKEGSMTEGG